jgi:hypothetical protein
VISQTPYYIADVYKSGNVDGDNDSEQILKWKKFLESKIPQQEGDGENLLKAME